MEHFLEGIVPLRHWYNYPNEKSNKYKSSLQSKFTKGLNRALPSRICSVEAPTKCKTSWLQWSKWLGLYHLTFFSIKMFFSNCTEICNYLLNMSTQMGKFSYRKTCFCQRCRLSCFGELPDVVWPKIAQKAKTNTQIMKIWLFLWYQQLPDFWLFTAKGNKHVWILAVFVKL